MHTSAAKASRRRRHANDNANVHTLLVQRTNVLDAGRMCVRDAGNILYAPRVCVLLLFHTHIGGWDGVHTITRALVCYTALLISLYGVLHWQIYYFLWKKDNFLGQF
jgi:hypothetical protein